MPPGMEVGLGPGHIVLDGIQLPQDAWTRMQLGGKVGGAF